MTLTEEVRTQLEAIVYKINSIARHPPATGSFPQLIGLVESAYHLGVEAMREAAGADKETK